MENNDIECPSCGASVFYELTRCPKCGWNFYDADANEAFESAAAGRELGHASGWPGSLKAILIGSVAAAAVAFGFHYVVSQVYAPEMLNLPGRVVLFLSGPAGALAGGYLAAFNAKRKPGIHGLVVGLLTIGSAFSLETHWLETLTWMNALLIVLAGTAGDLIYTKLNERRQQFELPRWLALREEDLYQDLLAKVRYDRETAERLIAFERQQAPQAGRSLLIQNAIERWLRDNR